MFLLSDAQDVILRKRKVENNIEEEIRRFEIVKIRTEPAEDKMLDLHDWLSVGSWVVSALLAIQDLCTKYDMNDPNAYVEAH